MLPALSVAVTVKDLKLEEAVSIGEPLSTVPKQFFRPEPPLPSRQE